MNRREFVKATSLTAAVPFWLQACQIESKKSGFPIDVHSDHATGHLMLESSKWPLIQDDPIDIAIIGGGIAGLTSAYQLKDKKIALYELSSRLGGTAGAQRYHDILFCQGAHYELAYPDYYGSEVLSLLEKLGIITYEPWRKMWSFKDKQHLIPYYRRQQCYDNGVIRNDVIPEGPKKQQFLDLIMPYSGEMFLPTRLIPERHRHLNRSTFIDFLSKHIAIDDAFKDQLDYHMIDDYGGRSNQVSALAGIHYFMCRPYYNQLVELFSPPHGNQYFVNHLGINLGNKVKTGHLVCRIEKQSEGYDLHILDIVSKKIKFQRAGQVIYAGQKHALKYICPEQAALFQHETSPWMVVNILCKQEPTQYGFWQNEYLGDDSFIGFIDSSVQNRSDLKGYRIFSGYYCLQPSDREYLTTIPDNRHKIVNQTIDFIERMIKMSIKPEAAFVHVMGHAMAIPKPGFLFNDANEHPDAKMVYAGVDNGRLPLLFEALDSGLMAANMVC